MGLKLRKTKKDSLLYLYIAYRNLKDHYALNSVCGGPAYNNDYRFTAICDGVYYLLTKDNMKYCYPNPALPEGDFELCEIYHGIYFKPDNTPASVIGSFDPDKKISCIRILSCYITSGH